MKKIPLLATVVFLSASVGFAEGFPYGVAEMTLRNEKSGAEVFSFADPVEIPAVDGGVPSADSVATLYAAVVDFCASDDEYWSEGTNVVGDVQAALAMKVVGGVCTWMGYTDGEWVPFVGVLPEEGEWVVKIDFDYSLGVGRERIRYSVGKTDETLVPLSANGKTWVALGNARRASGEPKIECAYVCGCGEVGHAQVKSGRRKASGTVAVQNDFGLTYEDLTFDFKVADPWCVDAVAVELKDANGNSLGSQSAVLVDCSATVRFAGVMPCNVYTYELTLVGAFRGADVSFADKPKEVWSGVLTSWFAYDYGVFTNAVPVELVLDEGAMGAAALAPRGKIVPMSVAPCRTKVVTIESTMKVDGAVQESMLTELDASNAQSALTVVRFDRDDERAWACRLANGTWSRLSGCSAENGTYDVRIDIDYREGVRAVSYMIRESGANEWTHLVDDDGQSCVALLPDAVVMKNVALLGGSVSRLSAMCKESPRIARGLILIVK